MCYCHSRREDVSKGLDKDRVCKARPRVSHRDDKKATRRHINLQSKLPFLSIVLQDRCCLQSSPSREKAIAKSSSSSSEVGEL